jgi:predicted Zn-ribbon and HTH transcriptional regulator
VAEPDPPTSRGETLRESLRRALREQPATLRELSGALGVPEKELGEHIEHLERSLRREGERLVIEPPRCLACGFEFRERTRSARPGRCPQCKGTRISYPRFSIA